jgi:hypothetical protein
MGRMISDSLRRARAESTLFILVLESHAGVNSRQARPLEKPNPGTRRRMAYRIVSSQGDRTAEHDLHADLDQRESQEVKPRDSVSTPSPARNRRLAMHVSTKSPDIQSALHYRV